MCLLFRISGEIISYSQEKPIADALSKDILPKCLSKDTEEAKCQKNLFFELPTFRFNFEAIKRKKKQTPSEN